MSLSDRRTFLGSLGAGFVAGGAGLPAPPRAGAVPHADLDALAALVRETPRGELLGKAAALHRDGTDWRDLLGAAFLAGIRDVEPRPVGFQFHCVMMTSSAFDVAAQAPASERLAAALFNLDDFKLAQARDARDGDWTLGPAPATDATDAARAAAGMAEALAKRDRDGADRAAAAVAHCATLDDAFESLWWFGMRDFTNIGHHPIFVAQSHRTLQRIGWRHGVDVLRSLTYGLVAERADDATFAANQDRAATLALPAGGSRSAQATHDLVAELRRATPDAAAAAAATALQEGLATDSLWDALRLFAAEQLWRDPGILAVHATTSVNALRYFAGRARSATTRAMAVLQAVSWQALYRDFLSRRGSYDADAPALEALVPADHAVGPAAVFVAAGDDARAAAPLALATARDGVGALMAAARHWLLRKAREHHQYKLTAALLEEMQAASPEVAGRMFAASLGYLCKPGDRDHPLWALVGGR